METITRHLVGAPGDYDYNFTRGISSFGRSNPQAEFVENVALRSRTLTPAEDPEVAPMDYTRMYSRTIAMAATMDEDIDDDDDDEDVDADLEEVDLEDEEVDDVSDEEIDEDLDLDDDEDDDDDDLV